MSNELASSEAPGARTAAAARLIRALLAEGPVRSIVMVAELRRFGLLAAKSRAIARRAARALIEGKTTAAFWRLPEHERLAAAREVAAMPNRRRPQPLPPLVFTPVGRVDEVCDLLLGFLAGRGGVAWAVSIAGDARGAGILKQEVMAAKKKLLRTGRLEISGVTNLAVWRKPGVLGAPAPKPAAPWREARARRRAEERAATVRPPRAAAPPPPGGRPGPRLAPVLPPPAPAVPPPPPAVPPPTGRERSRAVAQASRQASLAVSERPRPRRSREPAPPVPGSRGPCFNCGTKTSLRLTTASRRCCCLDCQLKLGWA